MSAALLAPTPNSLIGTVVAGVRPEVWADYAGECPVCAHPFEETHRRVFPSAAGAPMLLCFLVVDGETCFTSCGACRRNLA